MFRIYKFYKKKNYLIFWFQFPQIKLNIHVIYKFLEKYIYDNLDYKRMKNDEAYTASFMKTDMITTIWTAA